MHTKTYIEYNINITHHYKLKKYLVSEVNIEFVCSINSEKHSKIPKIICSWLKEKAGI